MSWDGLNRRTGPPPQENEIRLSLLEQAQSTTDKRVDDLHKNVTWVVRIVLTGVIGGMMALLITGGQGVGL